MMYRYPVWKECRKEKPECNRPIIMKGNSGYIEPHHILYMSGYYDPQYRPLSPWLNSQSTCVEDYGLVPIEWCYIEELETILSIDLSKM